MSKTGRNDPCPCGSGKKYKKCCLHKPRSATTQDVPEFAQKRLKEQSAFGLLLKESEVFRRFYKEVRPQLSDFILVHDPRLPAGIRAKSTRTNGESYIRLRTPVCPSAGARLIAHELGHLLLDMQGFPAVGGLHDHQAAAALNSAIHDPLIDARLEKFGFESTVDRLDEINENRRQLERIPQSPVDAAGRAHWTANCLGLILDQHVLGDNPGCAEFLEWFSKRFPDIFDEANKIASRIISMGFETPEKMFDALNVARTMLKAGGGVIRPPRFYDR